VIDLQISQEVFFIYYSFLEQFYLSVTSSRASLKRIRISKLVQHCHAKWHSDECVIISHNPILTYIDSVT